MSGRWTFISFKGLLLIPGHYKEAKEIIFLFASKLRHGLIPNLIESEEKCKYDRDTCWWFIKAISDYLSFTHNYGSLTIINHCFFLEIMQELVELTFLDDNFALHLLKKQEGGQRIFISL